MGAHYTPLKMNKFLQDRKTTEHKFSIGTVFFYESISVGEHEEAEKITKDINSYKSLSAVFIAAAQRIVFNGADVDKKDYVEFFCALSIQDVNKLPEILYPIMGLEENKDKKKRSVKLDSVQ